MEYSQLVSAAKDFANYAEYNNPFRVALNVLRIRGNILRHERVTPEEFDQGKRDLAVERCPPVSPPTFHIQAQIPQLHISDIWKQIADLTQSKNGEILAPYRNPVCALTINHKGYDLWTFEIKLPLRDGETEDEMVGQILRITWDTIEGYFKFLDDEKAEHARNYEGIAFLRSSYYAAKIQEVLEKLADKEVKWKEWYDHVRVKDLVYDRTLDESDQESLPDTVILPPEADEEGPSAVPNPELDSSCPTVSDNTSDIGPVESDTDRSQADHSSSAEASDNGSDSILPHYEGEYEPNTSSDDSSSSEQTEP